MTDTREEIIEMLSGAADNLAKMIAGSAFEFWQRKDFRLYVDFDHLTQGEQDRMFNELEVSVLGLFILHLENAGTLEKKEHSAILLALADDLSSGFLTLLSDTGIEKHYITIWEKLISLRMNEYREDCKTTYKKARKMKEFREDELLRMAWARIETITIDCMTHLLKGDTKPDDPLWNLLRKWFISLDSQLNPITTLAAEKA